jgi:hypothetical protein
VLLFWGQFFASFQPEKYDCNRQKEIWWKNEPNSPYIYLELPDIYNKFHQVAKI